MGDVPMRQLQPASILSQAQGHVACRR